jgi:MYXO-CTERM domain-containing protein
MTRYPGRILLLAAIAPLVLVAAASATEVDEGPVNLDHDCNGQLSVHHGADAGGAALRILGLYQGSAADEMAEVTVHVDLDETTVLLLTSHEPVAWHVEATGDLAQVIAEGDFGTQVSAPDGVAVEVRPFDGGTHDWWAPGTRGLVERGEDTSGLELRSFHGCYAASDLSLSAGTGEGVDTGEPSCDDEAESEATAPNAGLLSGICDAVTSESAYCLGRSRDGLAVVGLDSGDTCPVLDIEDEGPFPTSMAWIGDHVYTCEGQYGNLVRTSLADGSRQFSFAYCDAVTARNGELVMLPNNSSGQYLDQLWASESFADAHCGIHETIPTELHASRLAAEGGRIYASWHSASEVVFYNPGSVQPNGYVDLEGFDGWIHGLAVLEEEQLVVNATPHSERIEVFEIPGGDHLGGVAVAEELYGMVCMPTLEAVEGGDDDDGDDDDMDDSFGPDLTAGENDCSCSGSGNGRGAAWTLLAVGILGVARRRRS